MSVEDDKDIYENSYYRFIEVVEILAASPDEACERVGYFNVAFEIKRDLEAGLYLFNYAGCPLSSAQRAAIADLVEALKLIPEQVFNFTCVREQSLERLQHPAWVPLREQASRLLSLLQPATDANEKYLWANGK